MVTIEVKKLNDECTNVEIINRELAENIIHNIRIKEVTDLAYKNWSKDKATGVVALDLTTGKLVGFSKTHASCSKSYSDFDIVLFELDANVDVNDEIVLLGSNERVIGIKEFFKIDDETFSANAYKWTERYLQQNNCSMKSLRYRFIKMLYEDYRQAFYDASITKQLNVVYSFEKGAKA